MIEYFKLRWLESSYSCFDENIKIRSFLIISIRILVVALLKMLQLTLMTIAVTIVVPFELIIRFNLKIIKRIEGKDLSLFFNDFDVDDSGEE